MSDEDMQRTLCAEFGPLSVEWNKGSSSWTTLLGGAGYEELGGSGYYVLQQDIDLSGYAMERKTFYPYSSFEQRGGLTSGKFDATLTQQPYVIDMTIISSVPLSLEDLSASIVQAPGFNFFSGSLVGTGRFNREQIIHGELKWYTVDSTLSVPGGANTLKLIERQVFSSLEPTAADKLYSYRILGVGTAEDEGDVASWPATRVLIPGNISSEPKLEYMMRLKRSYELANQV